MSEGGFTQPATNDMIAFIACKARWEMRESSKNGAMKVLGRMRWTLRGQGELEIPCWRPWQRPRQQTKSTPQSSTSEN